MKLRTIFMVMLVSVVSAVVAIAGYKAFEHKPKADTLPTPQVQPVALTNFMNTAGNAAMPALDFTAAAEVTTPGVVHVTSTGKQNNNYHRIDPFFQPFFRQQPMQPSKASGSGVIISEDGYIVTNNHVISNAAEIEIVLHNNERYYAEVIGSDPSTDLALLKIDKTDLPYLSFANSDSVKVGSWVMAVGNPFNLASTVTAGIVSAKGRNINILNDNAAIESFIQTDAAVNPGNSGGALVDLNGSLIGINTAIASPTGSYAGYSFAVPSNLVYKVVRDLKEFGLVQRGFLGVTIRDIDTEMAQEMDLDNVSGVMINDVVDGSAAADAGLKSGDVIRKIDGNTMLNTPMLQEHVARHRPGDQLDVEYVRNGKTKNTIVTLKNKNMEEGLLAKQSLRVNDLLGVEMADLSAEEKRELGVDGGVKIDKILDGTVRRYTDMREGFVITRIDRQPIKDKKDLEDVLANRKGGVMIEGKYPNNPGTYYYAFGL